MHEQDMIALLQQHDERGMDALLLHCGPLMRYIIAPIVPNALDREECLSEASLRVWNKIAQFDAARGSWSAWLTAVTRNTALNFQRSAARHGDTQTLPEDAPSPEASPEEALLQASAAPRCTMRSHGSVRTTGRCFTGSITTCSPPHRSPPSSA